MDGDLLEGLSRLRAQVDGLVARDAEARERERAQRHRIAELEAQVLQLREELQLMEQRRSLEATAMALGPSSQDAKKARRLVAQLIREIDECIALLRG